jgi:hypothetical protein
VAFWAALFHGAAATDIGAQLDKVAACELISAFSVATGTIPSLRLHICFRLRDFVLDFGSADVNHACRADIKPPCRRPAVSGKKAAATAGAAKKKSAKPAASHPTERRRQMKSIMQTLRQGLRAAA